AAQCPRIERHIVTAGIYRGMLDDVSRGRHERWNTILESIAGRKFQYLRWIDGWTKHESATELPEELLKRCWSCRRPEFNEDGEARLCGRCVQCRDLEDVPQVSEYL